MAIQVGDNFSYQGAKPLDARLQYNTIADMKAKADATLYDGIIAFCKADSKNYQWKSTNPVDETLGKWREFTASSDEAPYLWGYLYNNAFYEESTHVTLIPAQTDTIYVERESKKFYEYDGTDYVELSEGVTGVVYQAGGSYTFANLPAASASNLGFVYNVTDNFTTTSDFVEGAGHDYPANTDVSVINAGTAGSPSYKYNIFMGPLSGYQKKIQYAALPTADADHLGQIYQYTGATNLSYTHGFMYECKFDGTNYSWEEVSTQDSGEAVLTSAVTSNLAVGAIPSGTTLAKNTTFTEFVQKLLITEIAPTIAFSLSKSGNVKHGESYTETLTVNVSVMGTAKKINTIKWYQGSTLLQTDTIDSTVAGSWTYVMGTATTDTTTFKAVVNYTKSDDNAVDVEKTASISFYYDKFYGSVDSLTPTEATVEALTNALATAKGGSYKFTTSASRIAYAYPKSLGALTSIKDGSGFSLFDSFTRTTETYTQNATSVEYYLYVLTDPTTVTNYTVVFA